MDVYVVDLFSSKIVLGWVIHIYDMYHSICNIHVATSCFPTQQLLALLTSTSSSYSSRGSQGLPRHTIMWNSLGSTWKSRSNCGGALEGGASFCILPVFSQHTLSDHSARELVLGTTENLLCVSRLVVHFGDAK